LVIFLGYFPFPFKEIYTITQGKRKERGEKEKEREEDEKEIKGRPKKSHFKP
jgi:hypothetical protein